MTIFDNGRADALRKICERCKANDFVTPVPPRIVLEALDELEQYKEIVIEAMQAESIPYRRDIEDVE